VREILEMVALSAIIIFVVREATGQFRVEGDSMRPTFHSDQYVLVDRVSYWLGEPQRGDIIVFRYPYANDKDFIKRVIGLPGETISIELGTVRINGVALEEAYIFGEATYSYSTVLGEGQYFVLGDNRNNSNDSHTWGGLDAEYIIGRAVAVYWPLQDFTLIGAYEYPGVASADQD
jgi:signal peptidase I